MAIQHTTFPILPDVESKLIGNAILVFITVLVVGLRFLARLMTGSKLGWDDYLTLACLPQGIGLLVCHGLVATAGVGYDDEIANVNVVYISALTVALNTLYATCIVTAKLSVLFFYLRVFTNYAMRRATKWMLALTVVWGVANLLQSLFVCRVENGQVYFLRVARCNDQTGSFVASGLFNCTTNLIINILPLYTIWSLKVTVSTRLGLTAVFLLSLNVTWASIARIALLISGPKGGLFKSADMVTFLTVLEVNISILCNSLPMLLPLYSYWRYRKFFAAGEDEYVSRVRGEQQQQQRHHHAGESNRNSIVQKVANGLPLEMIYGKDNVHFTATVIRGPESSSSPFAHDAPLGQEQQLSSSRQGRRGSTPSNNDDDGGPWMGDSESTRKLSRSAGVVTVETKWTITESRTSTFDMV